MKTKGFTLLEMSIVLTIMGLILGAMLIGRSVIRNAELQSIIAEVNAFEAATVTFQGKYNALPGDFKKATQFWSTASNGNGNGLIDYISAPTVETYFAHLNFAGLIPTATPKPKSGGDANYYTVECYYCDPYFNATSPAFSTQAYGVALLTTSTTTAPLDGKDALAIDQKMDDGNATTGKVGLYSSRSSSHSIFRGDTCNNSGQYKLTVYKSCEQVYWFNGQWGIVSYNEP